jgi:hypothetical protein
MKSKIAKLNGFLLLVLLGYSFSGCTATREQEVEGDLNEFRSWVSTQTSNVAERTEEDWQRTKADFQRRTAELDQKQGKFSDKLRADYEELKAEFKKRDEERGKMAERRSELSKWEQDLLGTYAEPSSINAGNVQQAYVTFMDNVRSSHEVWDNEDWEMAKMVLEELNKRKEALDEEIPTEDEVKIKALQMEFTALETGDDVDGN